MRKNLLELKEDYVKAWNRYKEARAEVDALNAAGATEAQRQRAASSFDFAADKIVEAGHAYAAALAGERAK